VLPPTCQAFASGFHSFPLPKQLVSPQSTCPSDWLQVRLWDLRTSQCQALLQAPGLPTVAHDEQGLVFCVGAESGVIKLFDVRNPGQGPFTAFTVEDKHNTAAAFGMLRFSLDGRYVLAVVEGRIYVLDAFDGNLIQKVRVALIPGQAWNGLSHTSSKHGSAPFPRNAQPHIPCVTHTTFTMQVSSGVPDGGAALEACMTNDGRFILSGCNDKTIRAWDVLTGGLVGTYGGHADIPSCIKVTSIEFVVCVKGREE
jgi:COMPASS component SWD2